MRNSNFIIGRKITGSKEFKLELFSIGLYGFIMRQNLYPIMAQLGMAGSNLLENEEGLPGLVPMINGMRRYQESAYRPILPEREIIWRMGTVTLQKTIPDSGSQPKRPVCLLIPSLINRSEILDLCQERSLARWLEQQGITTYILDWGMLAEDQGASDMDSLILNRLIPALECVQKINDGSVHVLGYCMGGTIALGAASARPELFKSLTLLAAPWDFHAGSGALAARVKFWAPSAMTSLASRESLPPEWLQTLFASLDPLLAQKKFSRFAALAQGTAEEHIFIALEDWLNNGAALPKPIARECILDWFLHNSPAQGLWTVGSRPVDPSRIDVPALVVASRQDRLVEFECAAILHEILPESALVQPECGHIGMIAGRRSVADVWQPIANWIKNRA